MDLLFTALALVVLIGCLFAYTRAQRLCDEASMWARTSEKNAMALKQERDRITVLEREVDALRRELRKLSGKFYAARREEQEAEDSNLPPADPLAALLPCENYAAAQQLGPLSKEAKCECGFCTAKRQAKKAFRDQAVPRTVQGQAELARLNAGKP